MKYLSVQISTRGSGTGISYYKGWVACPRRRWLDDQKLAMGLPQSNDGDPALMLGTALHGYHQIYWKGGMKMRGYDTKIVRFRQTTARPWHPPDKILKQAGDMFRAFRGSYPPNYFGRVVGVEKRYVVKKAPWLPAGMVLTAALDLEVQASKKTVRQWGEDWDLDLPPGYYIVDHKSLKNPYYLAQYKYEPQFPTYQLVKGVKGKPPLGLLVNVGFKDPPYKTKVVFIPPPGSDQTKMVTELLRQARREQLSDYKEPRAGRCYDFAKPCPYGESGECPRW